MWNYLRLKWPNLIIYRWQGVRALHGRSELHEWRWPLRDSDKLTPASLSMDIKLSLLSALRGGLVIHGLWYAADVLHASEFHWAAYGGSHCDWNNFACIETGHSSVAVTVYAFDDSSVAVVDPQEARSLYFQVWQAGAPHMQHQECLFS